MDGMQDIEFCNIMQCLIWFTHGLPMQASCSMSCSPLGYRPYCWPFCCSLWSERPSARAWKCGNQRGKTWSWKGRCRRIRNSTMLGQTLKLTMKASCMRRPITTNLTGEVSPALKASILHQTFQQFRLLHLPHLACPLKILIVSPSDWKPIKL